MNLFRKNNFDAYDSKYILNEFFHKRLIKQKI